MYLAAQSKRIYLFFPISFSVLPYSFILIYFFPSFQKEPILLLDIHCGAASHHSLVAAAEDIALYVGFTL